MNIELNGRLHGLQGRTTLTALIQSLTGSSRGSAVVVDGSVVPRSEWPTFALRDGQAVELITAVQGG